MHFLVIRPGAIGDTLLAFPVLKALRARYLHPHVTFVGNANVLPLALAFEVAEAVSDYADIQWSELFSTTGIHTGTIRDLLQHIDCAICWLPDFDGVVERNLRMAGIRRVIVAPGRPPESQHVVDYLAQTIGLQNITDTHFTLPKLDEAAHFYVERIAIHPGSGGANKCWSTHYFAAIIERLWSLHERRHQVLLLSGPADQERVRDLLSYLAPPPEVEMLMIMVSEPLLKVAYQLQCSRCYLGNDSGITHLAAILGIPTVALFGPSDPATWRPVGSNTMVIREYMLEQLSVDRVMEAMNRVLLP
jgi:heptosyltransferase-3